VVFGLAWLLGRCLVPEQAARNPGNP
jgi:hypothetical protein